MRIGLLAPLLTPLAAAQLGGSQALVCDLALALGRRGHQVEVIAASGSVASGITLVDSGVDPAELRGSAYDWRTGSRGDPRVEAAYHRAHAVARERDLDVLHNHAFDAAAIRAAGAARRPVVHTLHLPADAGIAAALAEARASAWPPVVACVGAAQASAWRELCPVDAVLGNGVPVSEIGWEARPGEAAVFAGRLSAEKGVDDAIRIALGAGMAIELYGAAYDPAFAAACRERWAGHPAVRFAGSVPRPLLWRRLAGARVVLAPSRWPEPFGLAAAEAQAAGTPVVGYRSGGLAEVVDDGATGVLVEPGDVPGAIAAIGGTLATISREGCRRHAERHLDIAATAAAHERLYLGLVTRAG